VGGGTSQADHFVLDPGSDSYATDPKYDSVIDTGGLFDYTLLYNPDTQQHLLASVPQHEALEYAAFIHEALSIWHTTSDAVAGRQADLRGGGERGGWVRVVSEETDRDFTPTVTTHGNTFTYDRSYSLATRAIIAGYDLRAGDDHVFGVHGGFMSTKLEHDDSESRDETKIPSLSSVTFGTYGGWWHDSGLTLDGTLNVNLLDIEHNVRDGLEDTRSNVFSVGVRAEAGWRVPLSDAFYVQPLATASYVTADIENLNLRDYDARFEDSNSARAALGVRLGGDMALNSGKVGKLAYWLTARAWEEYADEGRVEFLTDGDPLVIEDDISGTFEEVSLGVEATNPEGNLSAYFSTGATFGDDADNYNVSVGARMRW
jgi:outer membrane autotransporter protein